MQAKSVEFLRPCKHFPCQSARGHAIKLRFIACWQPSGRLISLAMNLGHSIAQSPASAALGARRPCLAARPMPCNANVGSSSLPMSLLPERFVVVNASTSPLPVLSKKALAHLWATLPVLPSRPCTVATDPIWTIGRGVKDEPSGKSEPKEVKQQRTRQSDVIRMLLEGLQ